MTTPGLRKAKLIDKRWISSKVLEVEFEVPENNFIFDPGQFISIRVEPTAFRAFSICSDYKVNDRFKIIADAAHNGKASNFFRGVRPDTEIEYIGPAGNFKIAKEHDQNIIFLCTGTGLAPFIPMFIKLQDTNYKGSMEVYFGLRHEEHIFYEDILIDYSQTFTDFKYNICLSQPADHAEVIKKQCYLLGRVTQHYGILSAYDTQVYICGNPEMVDQCISNVIKLGVPEEKIFYEKFTYATIV